MNWNQRITIAREALGIKKAEFSRRVGVSTATTADWESGTIKMIDGRNLVKAAEVLKVTPEWLMTGKSGQDAGDAETEFAYVYRHINADGQDLLRKTIAACRGAYMKPAVTEQPKIPEKKV